MIVVSNTSPLTNLAAIGQFDLLRYLFDEINIADGVWSELNARGKSWPGNEEVANAGWIHRHAVRNQLMVNILRRDLDKGEAETIVLASALEAGLILLDEKEGRNAARRLGFKVMGVVGLLLEAKEKGLMDFIRPYLDALIQTAGFRLSDSIYLNALQLAGEK